MSASATQGGHKEEEGVDCDYAVYKSAYTNVLCRSFLLRTGWDKAIEAL